MEHRTKHISVQVQYLLNLDYQLKQKLKAKEEYDIRQKIDLKLLQEKKSKSEI